MRMTMHEAGAQRQQSLFLSEGYASGWIEPRETASSSAASLCPCSRLATQAPA